MQTGTASIRFERPPRILQAASVVGPKEAEGPFGALFDEIDPDGKCGQVLKTVFPRGIILSMPPNKEIYTLFFHSVSKGTASGCW